MTTLSFVPTQSMSELISGVIILIAFVAIVLIIQGIRIALYNKKEASRKSLQEKINHNHLNKNDYDLLLESYEKYGSKAFYFIMK